MVAAATTSGSGLAARLGKLGIRSKWDLVLHLPLRYEDETKLTAFADARAGEPVLVEAEVVESKVEYRGRRTLVVKLADGGHELWVRFLHFYPSQAKQFQPGRRVRLFGEIRPGFFGDEMVHPQVPHGREGHAARRSRSRRCTRPRRDCRKRRCARRSARRWTRSRWKTRCPPSA